jgi:hypothetical protein
MVPKIYYLKNVSVNDLESELRRFESYLTRKRLSKRSRLFLCDIIDRYKKSLLNKKAIKVIAN